MEIETEPPFFGSVARGASVDINRAKEAATKVVRPSRPALAETARGRAMSSSLILYYCFPALLPVVVRRGFSSPVAKILNLIKKCK
jgi:hypothetical protein